MLIAYRIILRIMIISMLAVITVFLLIFTASASLDFFQQTQSTQYLRFIIFKNAVYFNRTLPMVIFLWGYVFFHSLNVTGTLHKLQILGFQTTRIIIYFIGYCFIAIYIYIFFIQSYIYSFFPFELNPNKVVLKNLSTTDSTATYVFFINYNRELRVIETVYMERYSPPYYEKTFSSEIINNGDKFIIKNALISNKTNPKNSIKSLNLPSFINIEYLEFVSTPIQLFNFFDLLSYYHNQPYESFSTQDLKNIQFEFVNKIVEPYYYTLIFTLSFVLFNNRFLKKVPINFQHFLSICIGIVLFFYHNIIKLIQYASLQEIKSSILFFPIILLIFYVIYFFIQLVFYSYKALRY